MNLDRRLENEIRHGEFLAQNGPESIWNWETPAGMRRWARRVRMLTSALDPSMRVLELGCGTGGLTREIAKTGASVTAVDISAELLAQARQGLSAKNVEFLAQNAYQMSLGERVFDAAVGSSVLHHLDIERALKEVYRVLRPGGMILFTEPNMLNPQIALQKNIPYLKAKLGDSPDETAFFKWRLKRDLLRHGFIDVEVTPFDFLHPRTPGFLAQQAERFCGFLEKVPALREIAGSLYIRARRPT
jgi:SAM-dependent methyltransferase